MPPVATLLLLFATVATGGGPADAGADARPDERELPRADQAWRFDGAHLAHVGLGDLDSFTKLGAPTRETWRSWAICYWWAAPLRR